MSDNSSFPFGLSPQDVIPDNHQRTPIIAYQQLVYLGSKNLAYYKSYWEHILTEVNQIRDFLQEVVDLLSDKTITDLQNLALQYDNPPCEVVYDMTHLNRTPGSTTLNLCEWCKYAVPKDFPYVKYYTAKDDTRLYRPSCGIMDYRWNAEFYEHRKLLCHLIHYDPANVPDLQDFLQNAHHNLQQYQEFHQITSRRILYLNHALTDAELKPLFPDYRQLQDYPIGTPVYFFGRVTYSSDLMQLHNFQPPLNCSHFHVTHSIITDHRENNYTQDDFIIANADQTSYTLRTDDARLISIEDLMYLTDHPDYFQQWFSSIRHSNSYGIIYKAIALHHELGYIP